MDSCQEHGSLQRAIDVGRNLIRSIKQLSIADLAISMGYEPVRDKDCRRCRTLKKGDSEIWTYTYPNNTNGYYVFGRHRDGLKGDTITFLREVEGWEWKRIWSLGEGVGIAPEKKKPTSIPFKQISLMGETQVRRLMGLVPLCAQTPIENYYTRRGISNQTRRIFKLGASFSKAAVPLFSLIDGAWEPTFVSFYQINSDGTRSNRFPAGRKGNSISILSPFGNSWRWFEKWDRNPDLLVFESPIDALSWFELFGRDYGRGLLLLSLCGNPSSEFVRNFAAHLSFLKPRVVRFGLDRDAAGKVMTEKLQRALGASTISFDALPFPESGGKDWNDVLVAQRKGR